MKFVSLKRNRKVILVFMDILAIFIAYMVSQLILSPINITFLDNLNKLFFNQVILAIIVYEVVLSLFKVYNHIIKYETGKDYLLYIFSNAISLVFMLIFSKLFFFNSNIKLNVLSCILISMINVSYRVILRFAILKHDNIQHKCKNEKTNIVPKNLLIIGAGTSARDIIKTIKSNMQNEYKIIGMIDDDIAKINYNISGVKVLGSRDKIIQVCREYKVDLIFFTIYSIDVKDRKDILDICQSTNIKIRILPDTESNIKGENVFHNLRDIQIEDLLYREPIKLDDTEIAKLIENKTVLVTGGGGSIGSELCRQIVKYNPKLLILFDIYENNLYDIEQELKMKYNNINLVSIVGSVRDKKRLNHLFDKYRPNLVFHAAAHKHVPLMENSPLEAIKNNVFGTYNVVNYCDRYNVNRFVLISTDKAVNPSNIMGATKRLCEMIVQAKDKVSKTNYVAVRFGNVLGSNGSVIPLFKKQIANGGPVTVTDKNIKRFFMTIPEAAQLVLQAITYAKGGEIFVLDMGQPVKIYDLAENLIRLAGYEPNVDIPIKIVGLRPGEKLCEEILMKEEGIAATKHDKIFIAKPMNISMHDLKEKLNLLTGEINNENADINDIKTIIKKVVPTYIGEIEDNKKLLKKQEKKNTNNTEKSDNFKTKIYYLNNKQINERKLNSAK